MLDVAKLASLVLYLPMKGFHFLPEIISREVERSYPRSVQVDDVRRNCFEVLIGKTEVFLHRWF